MRGRSSSAPSVNQIAIPMLSLMSLWQPFIIIPIVYWTTFAIENIASLAKKLGGSSGKLIHATTIGVSSSGLNQ
ncbi:hypothetical protein RND71_034612 [Anisodus tanguticus]|uniref:Uncharacterized protein n=1 Tax=Anisodus tanguticus TaxID=243964 RepID=A0AAE1RBR1_9SOLA|nr:hypothetical protein RND71_034612 [Anisodus tanguticus]